MLVFMLYIRQYFLCISGKTTITFIGILYLDYVVISLNKDNFQFVLKVAFLTWGKCLEYFYLFSCRWIEVKIVIFFLIVGDRHGNILI